MRFDDAIATVLARPAEGEAARAAKWRQLVDLLAQRRGEDSAGADAAFAWLEENRGGLPRDARRAVAASLAGLPVDRRLLLFFGRDHPSVAGPIFGAARLSQADWLALLPRLGPTTRAFLRHRRDLPANVAAALDAFGATDFVLKDAAAEAAPAMPGRETQIRELVARIEAYRARRGEEAPVPAPEAPSPGFRWETGPDGLMIWVDGAPRSALIGQSIAAIAPQGGHGVDGHAAGAFHKRSPFRDARLSVAGSGPAGGDWRLSGIPYFDPARGHFLGYRGSARRPRLDEVAAPATSAGLFGSALPADSLRQLVHELRTPLNAILGFAEMIDGEYLGPAAPVHRGRAGAIVAQAARLLAAIDDLDTAARVETGRHAPDGSNADLAALVAGLRASYRGLAEERGGGLALDIADALPPAAVDAASAERMMARLLAAAIGLAAPGETIGARMTLETRAGEPMLALAIDRPRATQGVEEAALLDPGYSPEGDWPGAPALGLGFALRLVRNLAEAAGGALRIGGRSFTLYLPAATDAAQPAGQGL